MEEDFVEQHYGLTEKGMNHIKLIVGSCRNGITLEEIANEMGVEVGLVTTLLSMYTLTTLPLDTTLPE